MSLPDNEKIGELHKAAEEINKAIQRGRNLMRIASDPEHMGKFSDLTGAIPEMLEKLEIELARMQRELRELTI